MTGPSRPTRDLSVVWAGIPSGTYRIHALGAQRDVTVDLTRFEVRLDLGGPEPTVLTGDHVTQALDMIRASGVRPQRGPDVEVLAELRRENAEANARGDWSCVFHAEDDPSGIPDGFDCGGCACHLSAPCHHCMAHLPGDDAEHISTMLDLTGRSTT